MKAQMRIGWAIAWREWRDQVSSTQFLVMLSLVLSLAPLSVVVGARDYQSRLEDYRMLKEERDSLVQGPMGKAVRGFDYYLTRENELQVLRVIRPPQPLSVFSRGLDAQLPQYWDFSAAGIHPGPPAGNRARLADTWHHFDFDFLVLTVMGLLAVLLGFNSIVGEKEDGTLRAALSHSVPRPVFLAGKLAGGVCAHLLGLLSGLAAALVACLFFDLPLWKAEELARLGSLAAVWALYLLCIYVGALLVSCLSHSRSTALLAAMVAWFVFVLLIPSAATLIGRAVFAVPPFQTVIDQAARLEDQLTRSAERELGAIYRSLTDTPPGVMDFSEFRRQEAEIKAAVLPRLRVLIRQRRRILEDLQDNYRRAFQRQQDLIQGVMWLSPAAAAASLSADIAGTGDFFLASEYGKRLERYHDDLCETLFDDPPSFRVDNAGASAPIILRPSPSISALPSFSSQANPFLPPTSATAFRMMVLGGYLLIFLTLAFLSFDRYDLR